MGWGFLHTPACVPAQHVIHMCPHVWPCCAIALFVVTALPVQLTDIAMSRIQAALLSLTTSIATINNITASLNGLPAAIQDVFDKTDAAITDTVSAAETNVLACNCPCNRQVV
jgi:hypothetical protein